ncbi:DUF6458 family protein [Gryllotalpicola ginsengisoli]|uniref:DUF6458 family protein n=1 Tax=Gryllotalpicola ginsengisoli TaxID=444608 RepID=UPI0003B3BB0A|nr:DUF6458 family protein [Gryllotalpicola ginsengisoli]
MSIGGGIFLIVVGAILTFALNVQVAWLNLDLVGYIFMFAGLVILIIGIALLFRRRRSTVVTRDGYTADGQRVSRADRSDDIDPMV